MQTSLRGIGKRAKKDSKHRFGNLYSLLNEGSLRWCFPQLNRKAAPGVDAVNYAAFEADLDGNIAQIVDDLKAGRYKAKLVRRRYIPKPGGRRPLGIPAVGDKVVQTAVALVLSAIFEKDFLPCSHGYRRGKGPQRAALELSQRLHLGRFRWVVDADIKGFFDHIDHEWLMRMLEQRIDDRRFLALIRKWLKAGILEENGQVVYPVTGTPQGGIVSAVLANIYLHFVLDLWFEKIVRPRCRGDVILMRFADDFVCCFQYRDDVRRFYKVLGKRLKKFKLDLATEKTQVIKFTRFETENSKVFTFLGFDFRWGQSREGKPLVTMRTSKKKLRAALAAMLLWIKRERCRLGTAAIFIKLRQKLQGHWNYYGVSGNYDMLRSYYQQVLMMIYKWLNRRSQRKSCNWLGFQEMLKHFRVPRPRIIGYWS
ncbi:MAG: group II intron reverse transcriptase/maturase [Deltaproteobacteria bacterium]|nr:group II intron reverse transcriptase/maturase [Deltaproteobacteria bacterium]